MLRRLISDTHSVPRFKGRCSRSHRRARLLPLALGALPRARRRRDDYATVQAFVQFAAFPRCGHSLIGSIIDAHRNAVVAHELDVMGLVDKGLPREVIFALIERNSADFTRNGRWWNGFRHLVPGQPHGPPSELKVIGDKKGDWAVRRVQENPELLDRLAERVGIPQKWIAVVRNPFDNIATMSLRRTGEYDRIRIATAGSGGFADALRDAQSGGRVAAQADDEMIADYEALCRSLDRIRATCAESRWHEIGYEQFVSDPANEIRRILRFLQLDEDEALVAGASAIVRSKANDSRNLLHWRADQVRRVNALIGRFGFLERYSGPGWAP